MSRGFKHLKEWWLSVTKFLSDDHKILKAFPQPEIPATIDLDLDNILVERALRVLLDPQINILQIKIVQKTNNFPPTKRGTLSFISSKLDLLGIF